MGVHGLWDLLAPVGRRVSVETLTGKRLAIDASIWMIQFMKAMRDDKGEMVRNAHLLGFFRRICKLLYLQTKPVFVFDGGTPALKRRTVIARRRQRENAQAKIRKTAEKLLLNQLKQIRMKELAAELEKQKRSNNVTKGKKIITEETDMVDKASGGTKSSADNCSQEAVDEMLAASLAAEEDELASELEKQKRSVNVNKGKKIVTEEADMVDKTSGGTKFFAHNCNQEAVDEMLAASLAAEEDEGFTAGESSSGMQIQAEEEDDNEDEEMILPTIQGKLDPAILAALPPSMQLDLLVQMRERLMAENRQKYQRVKKVPARFSELQIQSYLKTVAFRRDIDEVQKSAVGRGLGGVQTSRIASEANREFIFSSNYSGDKLILTSTGEGKKNSDQSQAPLIKPSGSAVINVASIEKYSTVAGSPVDEPRRDLENDVETYLDERGRVRVSRVSAMGIRMTRDIQRNLDLIKEIEEEGVGLTKNLRSQHTDSGATPVNAHVETQFSQASDEDPCQMTSKNVKNGEMVLDTAMEISFEDNGQHEFGGEDDDLFMQLVAGDPVMDFSVDNSLLMKQTLDSASEPEWEEGIIEDEGAALSNDIELGGQALQVDGMSIEQELEWEEGSLNSQQGSSSRPAEYKKVVSKGALEEEADIQEAIRRSLQDFKDSKSDDEPNQGEESRTTIKVATFGSDDGFVHIEGEGRVGHNIQQHDYRCQVQENGKSADGMVKRKFTETNDPLEAQGTAHSGLSCGEMKVLPLKSCESDPGLEVLNQNADGNCTLEREVHELGTSVEEDDAHEVQHIYACDSDGFVDGHSKQATEIENPTEKDSLKDIDIAQELAEEEVREYFSNKGEEALDKFTSLEYGQEDIKDAEASLEEKMLILGEECKELGYKQRKLERNAESVSSEMFAECQELLQIFGLPYIIAPMEAEAQCAYMELVDLVDGVVTDDSDAFLFGARNVYKNIFDDRKYVEMYFMKDIENELGLNREKLIRMALLLGSDYTEGVSGIGIVNAIEVVNAFPEEHGLHKFREWIESPDPSILGKFEVQGGNSKHIKSQVGDLESCSDSKLNKISASDGRVSGSVDEVQKIKQIFMDKHRNVSKNWHIPSSFPSEAVISAYDSPQVDKSTEPFSWGKPDHFVLRKLCWEKFGWSTQKVDELLLPVLREYNKRETQLRLEAFYTFSERFAKIRSKRIKKAVKGITGNKSFDLVDESVQHGSSKKKKRRLNQDDATEAKSEEASREKVYTDASNGASIAEQLNENRSRKTVAHGKAQLAVEGKNRLLTKEENCQSRSKGANVRGRSGGGGAGKDSSIKKARKTYPSSKCAVAYSDDERSNDGEQDSQVSSGEPCEVRRSGRPRKEVNYTMSDMEFDDSDKDDGNPRNEKAAREERFSDVLEAGYSAAVPSKTKEMEHVYPELSGDCSGKSEIFYLDNAKQEDKATDQLSACRTADAVSKTQPSEEYLTRGGGFCLDEDDGTDGNIMQGLPTRSTGETVCDSDPQNCFDLGQDEMTAKPTRRMNSSEEGERIVKLEASYPNQNSHDNDTNGNRSEKNTNENDSRKESMRFLLAIPNLKRKRRKI